MANTLKFGNGNWATKEGSTLAYNDLNSNFKPLPFNFSRDGLATVINKDGLIEEVGNNIPRIDFLGNAEGALKLEPSRTNKIIYSQEQSTGSWFSGSAWTVSDNSQISPEGVLNASSLTEDLINGYHSGYYAGVISNSYTGDFTISCFAKYNGRDICLSPKGATERTFFDLQNGIVSQLGGGGVTAKIENYGNGWFRCSVTCSFSNQNVNFEHLLSNNNSLQYQGDGTSGIYIFGCQAEQGSYATSTIKTQGSVVTRLRDLCDTENLSHVIGQTEGVIFYDAILVHKSTSTSEDLFELSIDDGSANNIFFINNYNNTLAVSLNNGGSNQFYSNSYNPTEGARYKLAFAYKQNDFALYINGNQIATDSSGTVTAMNQITFGNYYNNQSNLSNSVKVNNLQLYNTRLSNSELASLTQV